MAKTAADYFAWSLYTGPKSAKPISSNSSFQVGKWTGAASSIRDDLDNRIQLFTDAFKKVMELRDSKDSQCHFLAPEFFWHCAYGPYPYMELDGMLPVQYIRHNLYNKLEAAIEPGDATDYCIGIGTILTSNVEDYDTFFNGRPVLKRQCELNELLQRHGPLLDKCAKGLLHHPTPWGRCTALSKPEKDGSCPEGMVNLTADISKWMQVMRRDPLCVVRNRGLFFHLNVMCPPEVQIFQYEKQYESTVDLTMGVWTGQTQIQHGNQVTEWMAGYPSIDLLGGDKQTSALDANARFNPQYGAVENCKDFDVGVEVCLDHRLQRLRRSVGMNVAAGASANNLPLLMQYIPSGGMQFLEEAAAVAPGGVMFNADGMSQLYRVYTDPESGVENDQINLKEELCGVKAISCQRVRPGEAADDSLYWSHSQLTTAHDNSYAPLPSFNNALGQQNPGSLTDYPPGYNATVHELKGEQFDQAKEKELFVVGAGQLDWYCKA